MKSESPVAASSPRATAAIALLLSLVGLMAGCVGLYIRRPTLPLIIGAVLVGLGILISSKLSRADFSVALKKLGLAFASVLVTGLMLEIGTRAFFAARAMDIRDYQPSFVYAYTNEREFDRRRFVSHPFLPYVPRPFDGRKLYIYKDKSGSAIPYDYTQNSLGLRSPDRPFAKPPKTLRIITLGGSTTWDGPTNDQTWPALLEKKLNAHYAGSGYSVEVINMAADAYSSPMSLVSLALLGVEFEPDLIISYDGINDLLIEGFEGVTPDYRSVLSRFDDRFQTLQARLPNRLFGSYVISVLTRSYDRARGGNPDVLGQILSKTKRLDKATDPIAGVEYFERNLRLMRAVGKEYNAKFIAGTAHWVTPPERQILQNDRLREFFERERVSYVDLDRLLPHDDWSLHVDQVHWSAKGLDQVSEEWMKKIVAEDFLGLNRAREDK